jgi:hypothetical protein
MTEQERKSEYKKRLEEARDKKSQEPVKKTRVDVVNSIPDPVQQTEGILPEKFLRLCIDRFKTRPEEELFHFVEEWNHAALRYRRWLKNEGFSQVQSVELLNEALERADLDTSRFPVC